MLVLYIKEEISLSEEFFDGKKTCLDVKVKMIYDGKDGDIINQYVRFTRVCNEQTALYGRSRRAIKETIRIAQVKNPQRSPLRLRFLTCTLRKVFCVIDPVICRTMYWLYRFP